MSVHPRPLNKYCHHIVTFTRSHEEQYCRRQSHAVVMGPINIYTDKHTGRQQTLWEDERTSKRQASPSLYISLPPSPPYQKGYVFTPKYTPRKHLGQVSRLPSLLCWRTTQGLLTLIHIRQSLQPPGESSGFRYPNQLYISMYKLALIPSAESLVSVLALLQSRGLREAHAASRRQYMIKLQSILFSTAYKSTPKRPEELALVTWRRFTGNHGWFSVLCLLCGSFCTSVSLSSSPHTFAVTLPAICFIKGRCQSTQQSYRHREEQYLRQAG